MKLEEIKEIFQSCNWKDVNEKLKEGFTITRIFQGKFKNMELEEVRPWYVLAK